MRTAPFLLCSSFALLVACGEFGEGPATEADNGRVSPGLARALEARNGQGGGNGQRKMFMLDNNGGEGTQKVTLLNQDGSIQKASPDAQVVVVQPVEATPDAQTNPLESLTNSQPKQASIETGQAFIPVATTTVSQAAEGIIVPPQPAPPSTPRAGFNWASIFAPAGAVATAQSGSIEDGVVPTIVAPTPSAAAPVAGAANVATTVQSDSASVAPQAPAAVIVQSQTVTVEPQTAQESAQQVPPANTQTGGLSLADIFAPKTQEVVVVDPAGEVLAEETVVVQPQEEVAVVVPKPDASAEAGAPTEVETFSWSKLFAAEPKTEVATEQSVTVTSPGTSATTESTVLTEPAAPAAPAAQAAPAPQPETQVATVKQPSLLDTISNIGSGNSSAKRVELDQQWQNRAATLEFANGKLIGETACSTFSGTYSKLAGGQIRIGKLKTTEKACSADQNKAESEKFVNSLPGTYNITIDGSNLLMRGSTAVYQFSNL